MNLMKFSESISKTKTVVVPYNGISFAMKIPVDVKKMHLWRCFNPENPGSCHSEGDYEKLCGIIIRSSSKLKYLSIDLDPADCPHCSKHYVSIAKVLSALSENIEHLNIIQGSSLMPSEVYLTSNSTVFPKLETLEMCPAPLLHNNEEVFQEIINSAPNLKKVENGQDESAWLLLECLPPEKLYLLKKLWFEMATRKEEEMYRKFLDVAPALEMLALAVCPAGSSPEYKASFYHILQKLLQASRASLKQMSVVGTDSDVLAFFQSLPPSTRMVNLTELCFFKYWAEQDVSSSLRGIDFDRFFPSLETIQLHYFGDRASDDEDNEDEMSFSWTPKSRGIRVVISYNKYFQL